jgi:AmmeMemoRadiSam system protein B
MTKRKDIDELDTIVREAKRGRRRESAFILEVSNERNLPELCYVLEKHDLIPVVLQSNLLEVEYRKTQDVLNLLYKIHEDENFIIQGTSNFRHFIATFELKKMIIKFHEMDLKLIEKLETELLIADAEIKLCRSMTDNILVIEHDIVKDIVDAALNILKDILVFIEINSSTYKIIRKIERPEVKRSIAVFDDVELGIKNINI